MSTDYSDTDLVYTPSNAAMAPVLSVDNVEAFENNNDPTRVNQQITLPDFIKNRSLGNIITSSHTGLGAGLFVNYTVLNGTSTVFYLSVKNNAGQVILAVPDVSIYQNSISSDNEWPNGNIAGNNFPVYVKNDYGTTDNVNVVTQVVARNNSGIDQPIVVAIRWRIITNSAATQQNQNLF